MASAPKFDRSTGVLLIAYLISVGSLVIAAEVLVPKAGLGEKMLTLAAPVGAVLLLAANQQKTQDTTQQIKQDTAVIKHAVNGQMGEQFDDIRQRVVMLEGVTTELRDDMKRLLNRSIPPP